MNKLIYLVFLLTVTVALSGCFSSSPQKGDVALVNGDPITMVELETRRASVFPFVSETLLQDKQALKKQYTYVLNALV